MTAHRVLRVLTRPNVGGPTRQMIALFHACATRGWQTLLAVGECRGEPAIDLAAHGLPRLPLDAVTRDAHGYVVVPNLQRAPHPWRDVRARAQLAMLCRAFGPDVVHTHTSKAGVLGRAAARAARVPVTAHTFHGHVLKDYFGSLRASLARRVEARLARQTDLLFAVSPSCAEELAALGVAPHERFTVVPPAVDVSPFLRGDRAAARAELGLTPDALVLGFVGRLVPIKRPELFAATVARLPGALGLVFGDGELRAQMPWSARLRHVGATDRLSALLPACDALVITSRREGCPLAAVEAFAADVPVVGIDVPGVHDVLGPWGAGVLVPEERGVRGLVAALERLREGPHRAVLVAAARGSLRRFAPAAVAAALTDAYEDALDEAEGAARAPR